MKTIYAKQGLNYIIETAFKKSSINFKHYPATGSINEYYQTDSDLQVVIVSDDSLNDQEWYEVSSSICNYFKLLFKRFDFVTNVAVIREDEHESGSIELGIDMVEYGGGDWDEEITYLPEFTVLSHYNVSDSVIEEVIDFVKSECDDFGTDLEYEVWE